MPLGKDRNKNIAKLIDEYEKSGKIGRIRPKNKKHAIEIATAIAYRVEREQKQHGRRKKEK